MKGKLFFVLALMLVGLVEMQRVSDVYRPHNTQRVQQQIIERTTQARLQLLAKQSTLSDFLPLQSAAYDIGVEQGCYRFERVAMMSQIILLAAGQVAKCNELTIRGLVQRQHCSLTYQDSKTCLGDLADQMVKIGRVQDARRLRSGLP